VLLVAAGAVRVLLAGDIERPSEMVLLGGGRLPERVDLLVAPHHGSRTSSSPAFVARVRPRHVVYAAGYRHHFGHPHPEVVARYARFGAQPWNTASDGAVQFRWAATGADAQVQVRAARHQRHRYWAPD
jgi:competence protein ComEC